MSAVAVPISIAASMVRRLTDEVRGTLRLPYALRRVPETRLASLLPWAAPPQEGDLALARLEQIGKNTGLELPDGRRCTLHEGDLLAVVFGNRYATEQFSDLPRWRTPWRRRTLLRGPGRLSKSGRRRKIHLPPGSPLLNPKRE